MADRSPDGISKRQQEKTPEIVLQKLMTSRAIAKLHENRMKTEQSQSDDIIIRLVDDNYS